MYPRVNLLGVGVSAVNMRQAVDSIEGWVKDRVRRYVCLAPAHSLMDCWRDPHLRSIFNRSAMVTPDGMSLVWFLRLTGHSQVERVYGPDLMLAMAKRSAEGGYRHFLYGGAPGVAEGLAERLLKRFPGLQVVGTFSPPFSALSTMEDKLVVERINLLAPDIVWVGLGSSKQERWMADHRTVIEAPVLIGVGAAFDFVSGRKPQASPWMQRAGLEWLFRLATEPRRLWPRYRQYPLFVLLVLAQALGLRHYPIVED